MEIPLPVWVMILGLLVIILSSILPQLIPSWIGYALLIIGLTVTLFLSIKEGG
ncbi:MAG: hypothetical protein QXO82_05630 [Candidatus Methanomethylicia archaeon]